MHETLVNTNILNGSFSKKDFQFLSNCSSEIEKLDIQIRKQRIKRDTILRFVKRLHSIIPPTRENEFENLFSTASRYLDLVLLDLDLLNKLHEKLKYLEESIDSPSIDTLATNPELKALINDCNTQYQEVNNTFFLNDLKVEHYLKEISSPHYLQKIKEKLSCTRTDKKNNSLILNTTKDNFQLLISESKGIVLLPYTLMELKRISDLKPNKYRSYEDVIRSNFILPIEHFTKHPSRTRFTESFTLARKRESYSFLSALRFAFSFVNHNELNPAIIAGCKSIQDLNFYLNCLDNNCLDKFNAFKITFEPATF